LREGNTRRAPGEVALRPLGKEVRSERVGLVRRERARVLEGQALPNPRHLANDGVPEQRDRLAHQIRESITVADGHVGIGLAQTRVDESHDVGRERVGTEPAHERLEHLTVEGRARVRVQVRIEDDGALANEGLEIPHCQLRTRPI
jgi:hypothetical protein